MLLAIGRLVLLALGSLSAAGLVSAQPDTPPTSNSLNDASAAPAAVDLPLAGFAVTESTSSRPPLLGFRRPQFDLQRRDGTCLVNGTNFCFGDATNYCSSCGTCCSSDSNSKWCCPSDGICCGSSCCASGQTCSNGQCYLPIETVVSTSFVVMTATHVATKMVTIELQVVANSITNSFVVISDISAETQTNWQYVTVTVTGAAKRAQPTDGPASLAPAAAPAAAATATATAPGLTASRKADDEFSAPTLANDFVQELVRRQQAEETQKNMDAATTTTVVQTVATTTTVVASTVVTTTTVRKTSMTVSTSVQTVTTAINAQTTIASTSTLTYKLRAPVTRTLTEVATIPYVASQASGDAALSTATSPAALQTGSTKVAAHKGLSSGATAGIAVGVTLFAVAAGLLVFFCIRRHRHNKRAMKTISEDYAYLGTGRSDGVVGHGAILSNSQSPPVMQHTLRYSGPPPPIAAGLALSKPISRQVTLHSDDHGLPPTPTFITRMPTKRSPRSSTSAASASSPTSGSLPFGSDTAVAQAQTLGARNSVSNRTAHMRSGSAQTNLTIGGSTVVGVSARNSVQSTRGGSKSLAAAGGQPHRRASSSGAGSGVTVETLNEPVHSGSEDSPATTSPAPSPSPPLPPPRAAHRPSSAGDPPSPYFDPRPGPLRIINTPAAQPTVPSIAEPDDLDLGDTARQS